MKRKFLSCLCSLFVVLFLLGIAMIWFTYKTAYRRGAEDTAAAFMAEPKLATALVEKARYFAHEYAMQSNKSGEFWLRYKNGTEIPIVLENEKEMKEEAFFLRLFLLTDRAYPLTFANLGYKQYYGQTWWNAQFEERAPHFSLDK